MKYGYVYLTTNLRNRVLIYYIGQKAKDIFDDKYLGSGNKITKSINKFGCENFNVKILIWAGSKKELDTLEEKYIFEHRKKYGKNRVYNIAKGGGRGPLSKEARIKFGKIERTKEWCANISSALKGREINAVWRANLSKAHIGYRTPLVQREKQRIGNKKFWAFAEKEYLHINAERSSKANKGRKHSDSTKYRTSQNMKEMWKSDEYRKKMLGSRIGRQVSWNKGTHIPWTPARRKAYEMSK